MINTRDMFNGYDFFINRSKDIDNNLKLWELQILGMMPCHSDIEELLALTDLPAYGSIPQTP